MHGELGASARGRAAVGWEPLLLWAVVAVSLVGCRGCAVTLCQCGSPLPLLVPVLVPVPVRLSLTLASSSSAALKPGA